MDKYLNLYKYRPHKIRRHKPNEKSKVKRPYNFSFTVKGRFEKSSFFQQLLNGITALTGKLIGILNRTREPMKRLSFMSINVHSWGKAFMRAVNRQKHFFNTISYVILLHYYKVAGKFSQHFTREIEKVRKQMH